MSQELVYLLLIFGLLVIPRALQRLKIPAPITCLALGIGAMLAWGDRTHDPVVVLLSTLGISSLFLFAGLEVEIQALRRGLGRLLVHLGIRVGSMLVVGWLGWRYMDLGWQAAALLALAVLFVALQAGDPMQFAASSAAMVALLVGLPLLFMALGRWVMPHAPGSEFSLLVMVGMVAAYVTFNLGVYYLVGAFIAGLTARLLQDRMPKLASFDNIHALRLFATFFVPFYFFHAGTGISRDALTWDALLVGLAITAIVLPLRVGMIWLQRRILFKENHESAMRVSVALAPTLVFTLVIAEVLHARFAIPGALFGGLVLYTTLNTMLPSLLLRQPFDIDPLDAGEPWRHPEDVSPSGSTPPSSPPGLS